MRINWEEEAWQEYVDWQQTDKAILRKINQLIKDIQRQPAQASANRRRCDMNFQDIGPGESMIKTASFIASRIMC
jgi:Txe/YoeB family toxin of Txe-Axe toxin-antitoxin module